MANFIVQRQNQQQNKDEKLPVEIMPRNCIHSVPKTCAWLESNKALYRVNLGKYTLHMSKEHFM